MVSELVNLCLTHLVLGDKRRRMAWTVNIPSRRSWKIKASPQNGPWCGVPYLSGTLPWTRRLEDGRVLARYMDRLSSQAHVGKTISIHTQGDIMGCRVETTGCRKDGHFRGQRTVRTALGSPKCP